MSDLLKYAIGVFFIEAKIFDCHNYIKQLHGLTKGRTVDVPEPGSPKSTIDMFKNDSQKLWILSRVGRMTKLVC